MLLFRIAFRNVFRQVRRSVLTALAMTGGFVLASFSIAWADGSYNEVISLFTRHRLGHIQIHAEGYLERPSLYRTVRAAAGVAHALTSQPDVEAWSPRVFSAGLASVYDRAAGARIVGIDPHREEKTTAFSRKVRRGRGLGSDPANEAVVGLGLAEVLAADVGDKCVLVSQGADGSIANDAYTIVGVLDTGEDAGNLADLYLHIRDAQDLLVLDDRVHEIAVVVQDLNHVMPVARAIETSLADPTLDVAPWQRFAADFYHAMEVDQRGMWISLSIIILIVAVGVLNSVLMTVLERRREYGVLKALGTKPKQMFALILMEINILALGSILLGFVLAFCINAFVSVRGLGLPEPISYGGMEFSYLHTEINLRSFVIPAVTVLATATIAGLLPALKAVRTDPADAMRTT